MLAAESAHMAHIGLDRAFHERSGAVKGDVQNVMNSGNYYVTPQVCRELKHIDSGIDHIRLDHDFLRSSREWGNKFDPDRTAMEKQGAVAAMSQAGASMHYVKGDLDTRRIGTLQENQVRKTHNDTITSLRNVETDMSPYAHQSIDRIKQFCDHIGVTDRYTGYRHNLSRGSRDPVRQGGAWLDTQQQNAYSSSAAPARGQIMTTSDGTNQRYSAPTGSRLDDSYRQPVSSKSIQERCGINTVFPGHSEYTHRYTAPDQDRPTQGYIVNPAPDYSRTGRPLQPNQWTRNSTEYQNRYLWPDAGNMVKLPWLRQ